MFVVDAAVYCLHKVEATSLDSDLPTNINTYRFAGTFSFVSIPMIIFENKFAILYKNNLYLEKLFYCHPHCLLKIKHVSLSSFITDRT